MERNERERQRKQKKKRAYSEKDENKEQGRMLSKIEEKQKIFFLKN